MTTTETIANHSEQLKRTSDDALQYALKQGADRAKISVSASVERRLVIENKEFALANTLESQKVALLVHKDQRKGSATLNKNDQTFVRKSVDDALALAKFSVPDEFLTMPPKDQTPAAQTLNFMFDSKLAETDLEMLQEFAQTVVARLTKDPRVALDKCDFGISCSWHGLGNSNGMWQSERQTAVSWSYFGMAVDGEEVSGFDYDGRQNYSWDGALKLALEDAERFSEKVLSNLRPGKSPSYKGAVLFSPRAVEEILLGTILYHASGSSVMDGKSLWNKSIGQSVTSRLLTLKDHPHDRRFSGATAFDGDGLPTREHIILKDGVLQLHMHDCYSANRTQTTSNAFSGGPFALEVLPGTDSLETMKLHRSELLLVDRFSGNVDPIKGDFSGVAKSSRLLRNGKDAGAVTETMIAGNLFEILNAVISLSKHQELVSGAMLVPWVLADRVSVTGG